MWARTSARSWGSTSGPAQRSTRSARTMSRSGGSISPTTTSTRMPEPSSNIIKLLDQPHDAILRKGCGESRVESASSGLFLGDFGAVPALSAFQRGADEGPDRLRLDEEGVVAVHRRD